MIVKLTKEEKQQLRADARAWADMTKRMTAKGALLEETTTQGEPLTYKIVCLLNDASFYTDDESKALATFEQFKNDYGDGIRLYEALKSGNPDDMIDWNVMDYFDDETINL
jgi:hypothetical protein